MNSGLYVFEVTIEISRYQQEFTLNIVYEIHVNLNVY